MKRLRHWNFELRSQTAECLHAASRGITKLVAHSIERSRSSVTNMTEGLDANYLEMLCRWMDRALLEIEPQKALAPLHYQIKRYLTGAEEHELRENSGKRILDTCSSLVKESAEAAHKALEVSEDGIVSVSELEEASRQVEDIEQVCRELKLRLQAKHELSQEPKNPERATPGVAPH